MRSKLGFVWIGLLSMLIAGCTISIEAGGDGELGLEIHHLPPDIINLSFIAKSDAGFGHYLNRPVTITGTMATADLGQVASGTWEIELTGKNRGGDVVYSRKTTTTVMSRERTIVRIWDAELVDESRHGHFIGREISGRPLERYIDEFEEYIVPGLLESTGLAPTHSKPIIYIYGASDIWNTDSPCPAEKSCYDEDSRAIHVGAWQGVGTSAKYLTEAYVHWLVVNEGKLASPDWFVAGLARNEAERVDRSEDHWDNSWLESQWEEIQMSNTLVPHLMSYRLTDAFTNTAVAYLLEIWGGPLSLKRFFNTTKESTDSRNVFEDGFENAFGVTPVNFQDAYEREVARIRDR